MSDRFPDLLVMASSLEQIQYAQAYGADIIGFKLPVFSLFSEKNGFTWPELELALELCQHSDTGVYISLDMIPNSGLRDSIDDFLIKMAAYAPEAVIISDPSLMKSLQEAWSKTMIYLSPYAGISNGAIARFWYEFGIQGFCPPPHLSWSEICAIQQQSAQMKLTLLVHGNLILSYSPFNLKQNSSASGCGSGGCRTSTDIPTESPYPFRVESDQHGTYLRHPDTLCLLPHLPDLTSVDHLMIDCSRQDIYTLAMITHTYRQALDQLKAHPEDFDPLPYLTDLLTLASANLTTGAFHHDTPLFQETSPLKALCQYVGQVREISESGVIVVEATDHIASNTLLEFVTRNHIFEKCFDHFEKFDGERVSSLNAGDFFKFESSEALDRFTLVRIRPKNISEEQVTQQYLALLGMQY